MYRFLIVFYYSVLIITVASASFAMARLPGFRVPTRRKSVPGGSTAPSMAPRVGPRNTVQALMFGCRSLDASNEWLG